jgi:hypothetical protein
MRLVKATCAAALLLVLSAVPRAAAATNAAPPTFVAVLNGGQVVPPSTSGAFGVGFLTFNEATKQLCYSISYSQLQGVETEAHVHSGASGQTNAVLFDLTPLGTPKVGCIGPFTAKEETDLKRGRMYINIHTDVFVAGEIRGQILPIRAVH